MPPPGTKHGPEEGFAQRKDQAGTGNPSRLTDPVPAARHRAAGRYRAAGCCAIFLSVLLARRGVRSEENSRSTRSARLA